MAKQPYDKDAIIARFRELGPVSWNGKVHTTEEELRDALDASDPALFEPQPESVQVSSVLNAINENTLLDAVRDAHYEAISAIQERCNLAIQHAKEETESVKKELTKALAEIEKLKKDVTAAKKTPATANAPVAAAPPAGPASADATSGTQEQS